MGVWIETLMGVNLFKIFKVTPCMGVWIETFESVGRGTVIIVTPCMGVWIETLMSAFVRYFSRSHTLYGCVD